ncbi:MAG: hypothetical protein ACOCZ9_03490 [Spirochaetota bacterium]
MRTHARFFCENCHTEVRAEDKVCPSCGRFFGKVKCPRCEFTGEARLFRRGCPSCGYLGGETGQAGESEHGREHEGLEYVPLEQVDPEHSGTYPRSARVSGRGTSSLFPELPLWFYRLGIAVLLILLILLGVWFANLF